MIVSQKEARQRAQVEHQARHAYDHLIGKMLSWREVGDGFEDELSSPILSVHPSGTSYFVNENDEPRWIKAGQFVKDIRIV